MSRVYVRLFNFYYSFPPFPHVIEEMLPPPSSGWCWHTEMTVVICPHHSSVWQHSCPCGKRWSTEKLVICSASSGDSVPNICHVFWAWGRIKVTWLKQGHCRFLCSAWEKSEFMKSRTEEEFSLWRSWSVCGIWDVRPGWHKDQKRRVWVKCSVCLSWLFFCLLFFRGLWISQVEIVDSICRMCREVILSSCAVISAGLIIFPASYSEHEGAEETSWLLAELFKELLYPSSSLSLSTEKALCFMLQIVFLLGVRK